MKKDVTNAGKNTWLSCMKNDVINAGEYDDYNVWNRMS